MMKPPKEVKSLLLEILDGEASGLTIEALLKELLLKTGRHYPAEQLSQLLRANPQHFHLHQNRWRLYRYEARENQRRRAKPAPESKSGPIVADRYVVIDLEATGTDPQSDAPIEIAAIRYVNGIETERFVSLVSTDIPLPVAVTRITGLVDEDLHQAPDPAHILEKLIDFVATDPLVGHNISRFDIPMLRHLAQTLGLSWPESPIIDTLELALLVHPWLQSHTLESLGSTHGLLVPDEGLHRATADVELCHRVFEALCTETVQDPALYAVLTTLLLAPGWPTSAFLQAPEHPITLLEAMRTMRPFLLPPKTFDGINQVDWDEVCSSLARNGERRPQQEAMLRLVGSALEGEDRLLIEAPTGTGKTRAYLLPAVAHAKATGQRVVIAPHSRVLQDQILEEITHLNHPPKVCRYMGRQNLVCRRHLEQIVRHVVSQPESQPFSWRLALAQVLSSLRGVTEGYLQGLPTFWLDGGDPDGQGKHLREELIIRAGCMDKPDPNATEVQCYGQAMLLNSLRCDLLISNQVMVLKNLISLQPFGNFIFDEAHNLEDAATLAWSEELSYEALSLLASRLLSVDRKRGLVPDVRANDPELAQTAEEWQLDLRAHAEQIGAQLRTYFTYKNFPRQQELAPDELSVELRVTDLKTREWRAMDDCLAPLLRLLVGMAEELGERMPLVREAAKPSVIALLDDIGTSIRFIEDFRALTQRRTMVYSLSLGKHGWSFKREPLDVAPDLAEEVYAKARSVIWTSATLTLEHSFDFMRQRLGISLLQDAPSEVILPPSFDYRKNALLVLTNHLPTPRGIALTREFPYHVSQELARFIRYFGGRLLGLFTSRRRMQYCAEEVQRQVLRDGFHVYSQGGGLNSLIERFRREKTASLFGVKSLWEGVSVEGESLSFVAMSKLPFPIPTPLKLARAEHFQKQTGRSSFLDYDVPLAAMQFKQGFGRLNRTQTDRGAVLVLDRRLQHAMLYRDAFLRSLPGPPSIYIARGENFYRTICEFLGISFEAERLGEVQGTFEERLLKQLKTTRVAMSEAEYACYRPNIMTLLKQLFGHSEFRSNQEAIIRAIFCGKDVFAVLPTGSGKSLTFQLPALLRPGLTLVVSPLVALMKDQVDQLREKLSASVANCLIGGQSSSEVAEILDDVASGRMKILYLAPERLLEAAVVNAISRAHVDQVVVDEAHCVSMWGHSFRPEFLDIRERLRFLGEVPFAAVTATAPHAIRDEVISNLEMREPARVEAPSLRPNLYLKVVACGDEEDRMRTLVAMVRGMVLKEGFSGIIYVAYRSTAEKLRELLRIQNILAAAFHAGMPSLERHAIQEQFMNGDLEVVVATNAFGMGVDKPDVRFVIHYDLPDSVEMYYQEVGRAGRDGNPAFGILLMSGPGIESREWLIKKGLPDSSSLQVLAHEIVQMPSANGMSFLVDDLLDKERIGAEDIGPWLHLLIQAGRFRKHGGFTARLRLKLHVRLERLRGKLGEDETLLMSLFERLKLKDYGQVEFNMLDVLEDPRPVEQALLRQSGKTRFSFRALRTGLVLEPLPGKDLPLPTLIDRLIEVRFEKFASLIRYGSHKDCRWHYLRKALGDTDIPNSCSVCDRCVPERVLPWDPADIALLPETTDLLGLEDTVAEAVAHHDEQLGENSIISMLAGIPRNGEYPLAKTAKNSPFFGRLQAIGYMEIKRFIQQYKQDGLLEARPIERSGKSYFYLCLTSMGRRFLTGQRRVFDEEAERDELT